MEGGGADRPAVLRKKDLSKAASARLDTCVSAIKVSYWQGRPALTSDSRKAPTTRVNDPGLPLADNDAPFIRTRNRRHGNGDWNTKIFRFCFLR